MVIIMKRDSLESERNSVIEKVRNMGLGVHVSEGAEKFLIGLIGDTSRVCETFIEGVAGVEKIIHIKETYKLASRNFKAQNTIIDVEGVKIGGEEVILMAGPCSVESREQIMLTAREVAKFGAKFLRGGAYKPRTSPYGFQGLGEAGLKLLKEAKEETGLKIISEITNEELIEVAEKYVDVIQVGARNVQNFKLLKELGKSSKPILLKRGMATTIEEWLNSAEYIMSEGNHNVMLCERGIRTFENTTRNTLDISAVPVLKKLTHLPVIIDPSHSGGKACYVDALSKAGIAAGCDGLIIEVHPNPKEALSDAAQQIRPSEFGELSEALKKIAIAVGRK